MAIQNYEQAKAAAAQIRSGALSEEDAELLMDEIRAWRDSNLEQRTPETPAAKSAERESFFKDVADAYEQRTMVATDIMEATANGEQSYAEGMLQVVGKAGAGFVGDFLAESVGHGLSFITPDFIEDPLKQNATKVGYWLLDTKAGQAGVEALTEGVEAYNSWSQANPRAARNLEAVVNIGVLAAPVKGKPKVKLNTTGSKVSDRIRMSADGTEYARRDSFVQDLVSPPRGKLVAEDEVLRTETKTILGFPVGTKVNPTKGEIDAATALYSLPGISPKNNLAQNARVVKEAIAKEGAALEKALTSKDAAYRLQDLETELLKVADNLSKNSAVVGDANKAALELVEATLEKIKAKPSANVMGAKQGLLSDVFKVRKELDQDFIRAGRPPSRYATLGTAENGQSVALREIRTALNDFVKARARTDIELPLARQSAYYRALDNIIPKAASEASTVFGRIWSRMLKVLPLRGEINQLGALAFGMGGLGAGAVLGPAMSKVLFGGVAGYGTYRALTSPAARRGLASAIDQLGKAAKLPGLTAQQAHQLRADRAYLVDLLKDTDGLAAEHVLAPNQAALVINEDDEEKKRRAKVEQGQ